MYPNKQKVNREKRVKRYSKNGHSFTMNGENPPPMKNPDRKEVNKQKCKEVGERRKRVR